MAGFSYDSTLIVNLQLSLELLPVGNNFLISAENEVYLQKNQKIASSGRQCPKNLSMILHLLLPREQDMDAMFLKHKVMQLIGFSLGKIISLPALLPNAYCSNKPIETFEKRLTKLGQLTCKGLQSTSTFFYGFLHLLLRRVSIMFIHSLV